MSSEKSKNELDKTSGVVIQFVNVNEQTLKKTLSKINPRWKKTLIDWSKILKN